MSKERANDLARQCTGLVRKGNDFATVWATLLKGHTLVEGIPREKYELNRTLTLIPLITGEQLVFDPDVNEFRCPIRRTPRIANACDVRQTKLGRASNAAQPTQAA